MLFRHGYKRVETTFISGQIYVNLSPTQLLKDRYVNGRPIDIDFPK